MRLAHHIDELLDCLVEVVVDRVIAPEAADPQIKTPEQRAKLPGVDSTRSSGENEHGGIYRAPERPAS
jgi:hypothetical protein